MIRDFKVGDRIVVVDKAPNVPESYWGGEATVTEVSEDIVIVGDFRYLKESPRRSKGPFGFYKYAVRRKSSLFQRSS